MSFLKLFKWKNIENLSDLFLATHWFSLVKAKSPNLNHKRPTVNLLHPRPDYPLKAHNRWQSHPAPQYRNYQKYMCSSVCRLFYLFGDSALRASYFYNYCLVSCWRRVNLMKSFPQTPCSFVRAQWCSLYCVWTWRPLEFDGRISSYST